MTSTKPIKPAKSQTGFTSAPSPSRKPPPTPEERAEMKASSDEFDRAIRARTKAQAKV